MQRNVFLVSRPHLRHDHQGDHGSAAGPTDRRGGRSRGRPPRDPAADDLEARRAQEPDHVAVLLGLLFLSLLILVVVVEAGRA